MQFVSGMKSCQSKPLESRTMVDCISLDERQIGLEVPLSLVFSICDMVNSKRSLSVNLLTVICLSFGDRENEEWILRRIEIDKFQCVLYIALILIHINEKV